MKTREILQKKMNHNETFVETINRFLHNKGVDMIRRYHLLSSMLRNETDIKIKYKDIPEDVIAKVWECLRSTTIHPHEIYQIVFMYFGNKYFKRELDQFYTPMTICDFICRMLIKNRNVIDPACGTGDLVRGYTGSKILCDMSPEVLELTRFRYKEEQDVEIRQCDSLDVLVPECCSTFDYCILNPPFGNKTITTNQSILEKYTMGKKQKKQEIGILFVELGLRLLKKGGILFVIVPNGYLGNCSNNFIKLRKLLLDEYRVIGVIQLPENAFARSGTGVSTSILVIQNEKADDDNYSIFIASVKTIGYLLNRKNTPIKYKMDNAGNYLCNENLDPVIDNDLESVLLSFQSFVRKNNIRGLLNGVCETTSYNFFSKKDLDQSCILDVKRYLPAYKQIVQHARKEGYKRILNYCQQGDDFHFTRNDQMYQYIDISAVSSPLYKSSLYNRYELPARAKNKVKKGDIIISRLKGKISFAVITDDNLIVSNGFCVLRPLDYESRVILFANLFSPSFRVQHESLTTGSIMESVSDEEIMNFFVEPVSDIVKYSMILDTISILNHELSILNN